MKDSFLITRFFLAIGFALTVSACGALYEGSAEQEADDNQRAQVAESNKDETPLPLYKSGVSVNIVSGYASNDFGFAIGGRGTYNFSNRLTLGAAFSQYFNFAFFSTLKTSQAGGEIGFAFPNAPVVARPYLQAGTIQFESRFLFPNVDLRATTSRFYTAPGLEVIVPLQNGVIQFSIDGRYTLVPDITEANSFGILLGLGFRF
jgi:hypothetical protein